MKDVTFKSGEIRAFECYREAWQMIKPQFGMILIISLVGMLIGGMFSIVMGSMLCGIYLVLFDVQEGRTAKFERLFKGFQFFLPAFLVWLLFVLPIVVMIVLVYLPMLGMAISGAQMDESEVMTFVIGALLVEIVFAIFMVCFHTLLLFSFPLIVDKRLSALQAVKLSIKAVWQNLSGVATLFGVGFLVSVAGMLLFCVGIYLTIPLILASTVVAYRKVFPGEIGSALPGPPPPVSYQGL